ncbi:MAG TPA: hypothetical protein VK779_10390 [Rhizomicrobium sp.]|jgi:hypothetical protein|nr:hypothetical protein [Rhizomicrobium sp.]
MSKYKPLTAFLEKQKAQEIPMTFEEVAQILGEPLPASAYKHPAWWANETTGHIQAKAWLEAGYETEQIDQAGKKLVFRKTKPSGLADAPREFERHSDAPKKVDRHPMIGAMIGTITIEPGYDLAQSPFSDEELAEMEANLERTTDLIEQAMSKTK